jgi:serine/threonine protein phosphatase PrpC
VPSVTALALASEVRSDVGRRANNEDSVYASERLAVVADGVGGGAAGEVASRTVVDALIFLEKCYLNKRLDEALAEAVANGNARIGFVAECRPQMAGMGTTLTAVALDDDGTYVLANIGDSRTYLFRDRVLTLLTRDDSLVQHMIDSGLLTADDARRHPQQSVVLQALDGSPERRPTLTTIPALVGDRLLLCSDGLTDLVDDETLAHTLEDPSRSACADRLIELALAAGGRDNVSVIVADVVPLRDLSAAWRPG